MFLDTLPLLLVTCYDPLLSSKHLIKAALKNNDFLKNLHKDQIHEVVNCMYEETLHQGDYVIRENDAGNHLYVSAGKKLKMIILFQIVPTYSILTCIVKRGIFNNDSMYVRHRKTYSRDTQSREAEIQRIETRRVGRRRDTE